MDTVRIARNFIGGRRAGKISNMALLLKWLLKFQFFVKKYLHFLAAYIIINHVLEEHAYERC